MIKDFLKEEESKIPKLAFHTMNLCGNIITIFGGMSGKNSYNGDIYFLKLGSKAIINASYEKNKTMFPKPRHSHSANYDDRSKRLFIFGGFGKEEPHYLNQLCVLELKSFPTIVFQSIKTVNITSRCRHATFFREGKLYIYGGIGVDKQTKRIKVLNDFYYLDVDSGNIVEVTSKGGNEMMGSLFQIAQIDDLNPVKMSVSSEDKQSSDYAFFGNDLSKFYVFNLERETFTKIEIKFSVPCMREYYTVDKLKDGRIILFGGSNADESYKDLYYLLNYTHQEKSYWLWNRMDLLGAADYGYSGHKTIVLENNHLLIHGGTVRSFDGLNPENVKHEPSFTNRLQLFNIYYTYEWLKEKEGEDEFFFGVVSNNLTTNQVNTLNITEFREGDSSERTILNSIMNIAAYIPKEAGDFAKILIHGGEREDQTLSKFFIYNLEENKWMPTRKEDDLNFSPQLKGHSWAPFWQYTPRSKEYYIIISGGITIDHSGCKVATAIETKKKISNTQKQNCSCRNETISSNLYAYQHNTFASVHLSKDTGVTSVSLKRFGHSMLYNKDKDCIYILCGFIQYQGYVIDLLQVKINQDEDLIKKSKNKEREFGLVCSMKEVDLSDFDIPGRMHASVSLIFNQIVIFGGIRDETVLNDMYVINLDGRIPSVFTICHDPKIILPRFGMSSILHMDDVKEDVGRIIIFGGSIFSGKKMTQGIRSETLVFHVRSNSVTSELKIDAFIPSVYGFTEKKIFHSAILHESNMYVFGGLSTKFQVMHIPSCVSYDVDSSINDYESNNPPLTYHDWEIGNTSNKRQHKDRIILAGKKLPAKTGKSDRIANITTIASKVEVPFEEEDDDDKSYKSGENLIEKNDKSINLITGIEKERDVSLLNETNPLIDKSINNPLIEEKEIDFKKTNTNDVAKSILSSQNNSKKGFLVKKKNKKWDDHYDW